VPNGHHYFWYLRGAAIPDKMDRREFISRAAKAGVAVTAAGATAYALYEDKPRQHVPDVRKSESILDYSLEDDGPQMSVATGDDRRRMVRKSLDALGGIERFVRPGDRVLVKPNIGFSTLPEFGATSHPDLVGEIVRLCMSAGADEVLVTDNPVGDPESSFRISGIGEATEGAGGRIVLPREDQFRVATLPGADILRDWRMLLGPLEGVDRIIGVCPVKDHATSGATLTIKNWMGLLGGRRSLLHQRIHETLLELAFMVRPTLVILDGTVTMMSNGPTGGSRSDLKDTRTMIAGTDQVAVDSFGVTLLGRSPRSLPWIVKADAEGLGSADWEGLHPVMVAAG